MLINKKVDYILFKRLEVKSTLRIFTVIYLIGCTEPIKSELTDLKFCLLEIDVSLQLTSCPLQTTANQILPLTSSFVQQLSVAPLKRKCSFDNESCHQILIPLLIEQQDEFIQQRDILSSISMSSSNSSLSSTSDENIPIRTRSFMIAIKKTFERLKESSS